MTSLARRGSQSKGSSLPITTSPPRRDSTFAYEGIAVHPEHDLSFLIQPDASANGTPIEVEVEDEESDCLPSLNDFVIDSPAWSRASTSSSSSSSSSSISQDYFTFSPSLRRSSSSFDPEISPPSSTSSTPTRESPFGKLALEEATNALTSFPFAPIKWDAPPSPSATPASKPIHPKSRSKAISPPRAPLPLPNTRVAVSNGGASMLRSISTPVETQRQMDDRLSHRTALSSAMAFHAPELVRSKSSAPGFSSPMSRSTSSKPPVQLPFGPSWGSQLPTREPEAVVTIPYPYNIGIPPSPPRVARSYSTTDLGYHQPLMGKFGGGEVVTAPSSPTMRPARTVRRSLGPMTPILGSGEEEGVRGRLSRGLSF